MPGPVGNDAAAAAARRAAEQARREAEAAQRRAQQAQRQQQRAAQQAQRAAQKANRVEKDAGRNVTRAERRDVDRAQDSARRAETAAETARTRAQSTKDRAIEKGDEAIRAQQLANDRAEAVGKDKPFEMAEKVRDTYDAGSLSAQDQQKLFGTKAAVTSQEAAQSDARAVDEATSRSPAAGARELERQLGANDDPAYRAELFNASRPAIERITRGAQDPSVSQEELNQTVGALGRAADYAGTLEARNTLSDSLTRASKDVAVNAEGPQRLEAALSASVKEPSGARLALDVSDRLNEAGDYEGADRIEQLDPKLARRADQTDGETAARDSVQVQTAGDARVAAENRQQELEADAGRGIDRAFDLAQHPDKLPPNTEVISRGDDRVVLQERNQQGEVVARTTAERDGDRLRLETVEYGKKTAARTTIEAGPDGVSTQSASWKEGASKNPKTQPTTEELRESRDPEVSLSEERLYRNDDGNLVQESYNQGQQGIEKTTRTFSQQMGEDGIDDNFDDKFTDGEPIDKVQTRTVTIPPAGTRGPDGEIANPMVTDSTAYSQDGVQATATNIRPLEDRSAIEQDGCYAQPVYDDLTRVEEAAASLEDDKVPPKQWNLELSSGNTYKAQTFVEGQEDLTTTTTRTARGNTVEETVSGKAPNADGEPVDVSSQSSRTFRDDGSLAKMSSTATDAEGVTTVQEYSSERRRTAQGFKLDDRLTVTQTDADGNTTSTDKRTTSLITGDGPRLLASEQTVTQPDGTRARMRWDGKGESFAVGGPGEALRSVSEHDLDGLQTAQRELLATANASVFKDVQDYASAGQKAVQALGNVPAAASMLNRLNTNPEAAFNARYGTVTGSTVTNAIRGTSAAAGGIAGAAGLVASGQGLYEGIRDGNVGAIVTSSAGMLSSGKAVVDGATGLAAAIRGAPLAASGAAGSSGVLSAVGGKFGAIGVGAGLVSGGLQVAEGIETGRESLMVQGGVTMAAAVAAPVAATVVGGAVAGATAGSVAPVVGTLVGAAAGALVGLAAWGINKGVAAIFDDEHAIAEVTI